MTQWDFTDFIFLGYLITTFFSIISSQSSPPNSAYIGCIMMNWVVTGSYYSAFLMQYRTGSKFSDAIMHATSWHDNKINSNQLLMFTVGSCTWRSCLNRVASMLHYFLLLQPPTQFLDICSSISLSLGSVGIVVALVDKGIVVDLVKLYSLKSTSVDLLEVFKLNWSYCFWCSVFCCLLL